MKFPVFSAHMDACTKDSLRVLERETKIERESEKAKRKVQIWNQEFDPYMITGNHRGSLKAAKICSNFGKGKTHHLYV